MDLKKITNRNRDIAKTETRMTVEIPVTIDTIRVNAEQTIALATMGDKIVLVPEKGENAVTSLEMTPAEFGAMVKALVQKAQDMGVMDKAPKAERRPYTRRNTAPPAPPTPSEDATPSESATPSETDEASFKVETIRPARPTPEELAARREELAREATMDFATEQVYDVFAPDAL